MQGMLDETKPLKLIDLNHTSGLETDSFISYLCANCVSNSIHTYLQIDNQVKNMNVLQFVKEHEDTDCVHFAGPNKLCEGVFSYI